MDIARYLLTEPMKSKEKNAQAKPSEGAYRKLLAEKLLNNRTRILTFWKPEPGNSLGDAASIQDMPPKKRRNIPQVRTYATFTCHSGNW